MLVVTTAGPVTATWRASGLGRTDTGITEVSAGYKGTDLPDSPFPAAAIIAPFANSAHDALTRLANDGWAATWEAVQALEPYVRTAVDTARSRVAQELNPDRPPLLLDDLDLEALTTSLVLGDIGTGPSAFARMIERCARPDTFARVDPLRYVRITIRRDVEQALRRRIGDPFIGPKIRKTARALGTVDIDKILTLYRSRWPGDRLGAGRAAAALELAVFNVNPAVPFADPSWLADLSWRDSSTTPP